MDLGSTLTWLRLSPRRSGIGLGLAALLIWFVVGLFLTPGVGHPEWGGPDLAGLLIGLGLLAGLTVPGWRAWGGYLIGGVTMSIVIGIVAAFLPYDPGSSDGDIPITGLALTILVAFAGGLFVVVSSVGYPLATIVRALISPSTKGGPTERPSGDIGAH